MVPTAATQLMQHKVDADVVPRYALCGSSTTVELFKRFQEKTGVEIIGYGMTEATC